MLPADLPQAAAPTAPVAEPPSANDKGKEPMTAAEAPAPAHGDGHAEGDEGEEEDEEDDSEKTDMELAWENLETAKLIYNNHMEGLSEEQRLSLAGETFQMLIMDLARLHGCECFGRQCKWAGH